MAIPNDDAMDANPVENIFNIFRELGDRSYGEDVTELEHALQTAEFAQQFCEPDAIVLSCLLHDYGFTPIRAFAGFAAAANASSI